MVVMMRWMKVQCQVEDDKEKEAEAVEESAEAELSRFHYTYGSAEH